MASNGLSGNRWRLQIESEAAQLTHWLGGNWRNGRGLCLCPAHDDHNPSLSIRVGDKALLFKCFAGCDTIEVIRAIRRLRLPLERPAPSGPSFPGTPVHAGSSPVWRIWNASVSVTGTLAETYLSSRFLTPPWRDLRYNARTPLGKGDAVTFRPALIAGVREGDRLVAIHRTFLDIAQATKARDLADPRLMLGRPGKGAVQLAPATSVLGLAEGLETALAAMKLHHIPVWATLGAERAARILLPDRLERLILLFDDDTAGWKANLRARLAYERPDLEIYSLWPVAPHNDWANMLETIGRAA